MTTPEGQALVELAARLVEDGYRCRSCDAVFTANPVDRVHGGHPDNKCERPNWDKLTEEEQVKAIRALSLIEATHGEGTANGRG